MVFWGFFDNKNHILIYFKLKLVQNMLNGGSCRLNLVSLKNIDSWPSYGPKFLSKYQLFHIYWHTFFGHNSAIYWKIGRKFFWGLKRLLSIEKFWFGRFSKKKKQFLAGKWAWPPRWRQSQDLFQQLEGDFGSISPMLPWSKDGLSRRASHFGVVQRQNQI